MIESQTSGLLCTLKAADPAFDPRSAGKYRLHLSIAKTRIIFGVSLVASPRKLLWFEEHLIEPEFQHESATKLLEIEAEHHPVLGIRGWHSVQVISTSSKFTLVPNEYYHQEALKHYLYYTTKIPLEGQIHSEAGSFGGWSVFEVQSEDLKIGAEYTEDVVIYSHFSTQLIQLNLAMNHLSASSLTVFMQDDEFWICASKMGRLLTCNSYHPKSLIEAAYFISSVCEANHLKASDTKILFYGNPEAFKPLLEYISPRFDLAGTGVRPEMVSLGPVFGHIPAPRLATIISAALL